jgi:hypothetical protein
MYSQHSFVPSVFFDRLSIQIMSSRKGMEVISLLSAG